MSVALAPQTFRIPISFVFRIIINHESPNNPMQAMAMASMANNPKMVLNCFSAWYCWS